MYTRAYSQRDLLNFMPENITGFTIQWKYHSGDIKKARMGQKSTANKVFRIVVNIYHVFHVYYVYEHEDKKLVMNYQVYHIYQQFVG